MAKLKAMNEVNREFDATTKEALVSAAIWRNPAGYSKEELQGYLEHYLYQYAEDGDRELLADKLQAKAFLSDYEAGKLAEGLDWKKYAIREG